MRTHQTFSALAFAATLLALPVGSIVTAQPRDVRPSSEDETVLKNTAQGLLLDAALAELARARAKQPEVITFAAQVTADSAMGIGSLRALGGKYVITLPTDLTATQQEIVARLANSYDVEFDHAFVDEMIRTRRGDLAAIGAATQSASNREVRDCATKIAASIEAQLSAIQGLTSNNLSEVKPPSSL